MEAKAVPQEGANGVRTSLNTPISYYNGHTDMFRSFIIILAAALLVACVSGSSDQRPARGDGPQSRAGSGQAPMPDLADAAEKLGVTEAALSQALRDAGGPPPDFDKVAEMLGVSTDDLQAALPPPPRRR